MTKTVYIVGSKGIPAKYGGFETFVEKLTEFQQDKDIPFEEEVIFPGMVLFVVEIKKVFRIFVPFSFISMVNCKTKQSMPR